MFLCEAYRIPILIDDGVALSWKTTKMTKIKIILDYILYIISTKNLFFKIIYNNKQYMK